MNLQPTIFISSIISEFYDLRGALKYFLGKNGFRVLMSEEPDFGAVSHKDSLDNCKEQIEKADYYFLIIGNKPGYIFELEGKKTTVTFEEFKHYVHLVKNGKTLNFIAFVRKGAWDNHLVNNADIDPLQIELIKFLVEDSLFEDTKIGRWRYTFEKFGDIINVLETNQNGLFLESTRRTHIYREYIKRDIIAILKELITKKSDASELTLVTDFLNLRKEDHLDFMDKKKLNKDIAVNIATFCSYITSRGTMMKKVNRIFNYIAQGEFSRFDPLKEKYVLPEFVKLTIQTLEIIEHTFDNVKIHDFYTEISKRNVEYFLISGFEYSMIRSNYENLKIATKKIINLAKLFFLNWDDFEIKDDAFYSFRGTVSDDIPESDLKHFVENYK